MTGQMSHARIRMDGGVGFESKADFLTLSDV